MTDRALPQRSSAELESPSSGLGLPGTRTVALFVRMWAIAHLIHLSGATGSRLDTPWNVTVFIAALALLLRPTSGGWFALLAGAQIVDMVWEMPFSPDHWMLLAFVNLTFLLTMAFRRSWDMTTVASAFPAARLVALIAYSAAALAKYNTEFLDPASSCAAAIANTASYGLAGQLDAAPLWIFSVIITETSIPILLAIPATRRHGVRIAFAFHFVLSASPAFAVVDYSAALFALFILFLSDQDIANTLDRINKVVARSAIARDARRKPWVTAVLAFVVFGLLGYLSPVAGSGFLLVFSELYLIGMLLAVLLSWRASRDTRAFGKPAWIQVPVFLLLVIWISSPYMGFRTTSVFTMFSGVRTEGDIGNHLFLPNFRVMDWQDDFVVIESSNDSELSAAEDGRAGVPLMALRRLATDDPDLVVVGRIDGELVTFGPEPGQRHLEPLHGWQYKFLHFRPVATSDRSFCSVS